MLNNLDIIKQNRLFASLSDTELEQVLALMEETEVEAGEYIIRQGEHRKELYLILEGSVEVLKKEDDSVQTHRLATLSSGEIFGELAILDRGVRSSSVRAIEKTVLLVLTDDALEQLINIPPLYAKLLRNLTSTLTNRVRTTDTITIQALERELQKTKVQVVAGNFMVSLLIVLTLFTFLLNSLSYLSKSLGTSAVITVPTMLLLLGLFAIGVKRSGYPASFYGFTLDNWQRACTEAVLFTIPILLLCVGAKWWVITHLPHFSHEALFNWGQGASTKPIAETWLITTMALAYVFISSPIQEVLFRGGLQTTLQTFLLGKHRYFLAILTSNLIFAMMHLVLSSVLAILTFAVGLFWGWLYKRHGTLVGVILSHVLIGFWVFFILGIHRIVIVPV